MWFSASPPHEPTPTWSEKVSGFWATPKPATDGFFDRMQTWFGMKVQEPEKPDGSCSVLWGLFFAVFLGILIVLVWKKANGKTKVGAWAMGDCQPETHQRDDEGSPEAGSEQVLPAPS